MEELEKFEDYFRIPKQTLTGKMKTQEQLSILLAKKDISKL